MLRKFPFPNRRRLRQTFSERMRNSGYSIAWLKFGEGQIEIVTNSKDKPKVIRYRE